MIVKARGGGGRGTNKTTKEKEEDEADFLDLEARCYDAASATHSKTHWLVYVRLPNQNLLPNSNEINFRGSLDGTHGGGTFRRL
jgi:hypothetical protein